MIHYLKIGLTFQYLKTHKNSKSEFLMTEHNYRGAVQIKVCNNIKPYCGFMEFHRFPLILDDF